MGLQSAIGEEELVASFNLGNVPSALLDNFQESVYFCRIICWILTVVVDLVIQAGEVKAFVAEVINTLSGVTRHPLTNHALECGLLEPAEVFTILHFALLGNERDCSLTPSR
jgi:hypothetical protein